MLCLASPVLGQCELAKLIPHERPEFHNFGRSLALHGVHAMAGAIGDREVDFGAGAAYFLDELAPCNWGIVQKVVASDGGREELFGSGAAMLEGVVFVGARRHAIGGAAYVFEPDADGIWREVQKLLPQGATLGAEFGDDLAVDGDVLIGGARRDNVRFSDDGAAYVFERDERGSWAQVARLNAPDGSGGDAFGSSVGVSGTTVVIGAANNDDQGQSAGTAYVFDRDEQGVWGFTSKLLAADGREDLSFGRAAAIDGDRIIVGASNGGGPKRDASAVYVYERDPDGRWNQTAKLVPPDTHREQLFGFAVALEGRRAVIGAIGDEEHGRFAGAVYVYQLADDDTWRLRAKLTASDADVDGWLGFAVAVSGDTLLSGAKDGPDEAGAAYVFDLAPLTPDLDGDEEVDVDDYALFAECITGPGVRVRAVCESADLDCDDDVDLADFVRFQVAMP
jgi:hypothetical protein